MRVPLEWLQEYVDPGIPVEELEQRLTMTGTKVEAVHHHGVGDPSGFVVGRVLSAERHPNADRLSVCVVDLGDGAEPSQIVCGAPNVAAGQIVAVARPGAVMPDGTKLGKAKLRGVESAGMILAEDEVSIGTGHAGIMVLDEAIAPGTPLAEVLPISTPVLELEITPNRPDCLGVYGIAREVHAVTGAPLATPPWAGDCGCEGPTDAVEVIVEAPDLCPRFTARVFENVKIGPSPEWLKARLMAAGQRPINNVVDITNYVMLMTGQPLHAFDLDRIEGQRLVVRRAREGEQMETLDGQVRTLDPEIVVIEDDRGPTSIAGVMGGNRSEVHEGTTRVLMEAANWNGPNINRTMQRLNIRTEAGARFEKQLSVESALEGLASSSVLMTEVVGATLLDGTIDVGRRSGDPVMVRLRDSRVSGLLGQAVPRQRSGEILEALGFAVSEAEDGLVARVPHFRRHDVTREADLVEEVARIDGLERLPATLPSRRGAVGVLTSAQRLLRRAEDTLTGLGLDEIVGWSFTGRDVNEALGLPEGIALENPMTEEQSVMRTTLLGSLLEAARHNVRRGAENLWFFEAGDVYLPAHEDQEPYGDWAPPVGSPGWIALREQRIPDERSHLGVLLTGAVRPAGWDQPRPPKVDVFAAKGVLEAVLGALRVQWSVQPATRPFLHPGRAADILVDGRVAGWLGELHPTVAARWDLDGAAGFELDMPVVLRAADEVPIHRDLTSFPSVRQDIAVAVADDVPAAEVLDVVRGAAGNLLEHAEVFDVYRGAQVGEGRMSLALRLEFRAPDRTLTDEEVAERREAIVTALREKLGGELRA
jgi:phenylalanyl-tRNA synthetase beta chain